MARSSPYLNPYTTTGGSAQFGGAPSSLGTSLGTSLSLSMSMGMSSLRSSSNCVDEEDEREAEAEAEAERERRERHARVDHGVPMPAKRSASGMPLSMAMLEEDRHAVASSKEDDQETVDGSWDEERDERGVGMEMEMDL
ncbi:hypothetical protein DL93DRAFT_2078407 [Clavulina sp. PMI_390]|nr:hypothetical protein DL93DRAFT_2078407 [Clavulina sp. PMI_390]